jgi:hypothetical protein
MRNQNETRYEASDYSASYEEASVQCHIYKCIPLS